MQAAARLDAPDFEQDTANGSIRFHAWMGRAWGLLFLQPGPFSAAKGLADIAALLALRRQWALRGIKVLAVAPDTAASALQAVAALEASDAGAIDLPLVADADGAVAALYRPAAPEPGTRHAIIIDPTHQIRLVVPYRPGTACDGPALLHAIDALQDEF